MTTFDIYQARRRGLRFENWDLGRFGEVFPSEFEKVARASAYGPEEIFDLSQHVDIGWTEKSHVEEVHSSSGIRSLSVGDVLVSLCEEHGEPDRAHVVRRMGFESISL